MGQIVAFKCDHCNKIFEEQDKFESHMVREVALANFYKKYPNEYHKPGCSFTNGEYCMDRTSQYIKEYKKDMLKLVRKFHKIEYEPLTYGWFRTLNDGNSMFYGIACKILDFCPTCHREWGSTILRQSLST